MNRVRGAGIVLTVVGLAGYVLGITTDYPGRGFSVTLLMVGITLIAVHRVEEVEA